MRAARFHGGGVLRVEECARPEPGPGEVLVEVHAVGVNQLERQIMAGSPLGGAVKLPRTVGLDPAGVIVSGERAGQRVAVKPNVPCGDCAFCTAGHEADCPRQQVVGIHRDGGAAGYVAVPEAVAFDVGEIPFAEAAAAVHSVPIALHMIRRALGPAAGTPDALAGRTVLVTGATGALGCAAVQVAAAMGATVLAGVLEGEPAAGLPALGATEVLSYPLGPEQGPALAKALREPPDLIVDATGSGDLIAAELEAVAWAGSVVVAAALPGSRFTVDTRAFYTRRITLYGCAAADYADVRDGLDLVARGLVRPPVAARLPLAEVGEAFAMAGRRDHLGKIILEVR
ncbi:alcohol dehydrogenase catalytic domain-containing protein [Nonomuraea sp. NPDC050310]|uniref:alcohol dehydrogenase catalytic domain-containing protein n=1 Tax=unclassified Nonomuraea TaxID=2593643 RepID=UPI003410CCF3